MATNKTKKTSDTETTTNGSTGTKTAFVLSLPVDMPASAVVAKAADAGLKIREKYVYNIRAAARQRIAGGGLRKKPGPKPGTKAVSKPAATPASLPSGLASTASSSAVEARFLDAALDLGLARASELLDRLRAKLKKFVL
jgi:hypothetical protein